MAPSVLETGHHTQLHTSPLAIIPYCEFDISLILANWTINIILTFKK